MEKNKAARRDFIKMSALAFGGLSLAPLATAEAKPVKPLKQIRTGDKKLNIVCLGAHPGDPEFGCGGAMAKYSEAGHTVTFLYLTRGEASDPNKTYAEMAALRTREAETACKILNAKPAFAGQIDGNSVLDKEWNEKATKML